MDKVKMVHYDCNPVLVNDRKLPYNSWLITYILDAAVHYDITIADREVDVFDYYWDRYRDDIVKIIRSEGRVNPRVWTPETKKDKKKK